MIGVVIPAHNEEKYITSCLQSVIVAASHPELAGAAVLILVVLDNCTDATEALAATHDVSTLNVNFNNVGRVRALGAEHLLDVGVQWLAFTDADTRVPPDWLVRQIGFKADAVCGIVEVDSWNGYADSVRSRYMDTYQFREDHRHVHGANFGVSAEAYRRAGGFQHLKAHEDVRLVADLERTCARIAWTATNPVITSARTDFKCREGFGEYLIDLAASLCVVHDESSKTVEVESGVYSS